jgi:hypothetical protein
MTTIVEVSTARRCGRLWLTALLAAAVATGGSLLVYLLARAAGVSLELPLMPGTTPALLPLGMVVAMSLAGAVVGTLAFAVLSWLAPGRRWLFPIFGIAFLLLSLGAPLTLEATDAATKATLVLMHVVAGGSIIALLARSAAVGS